MILFLQHTRQAKSLQEWQYDILLFCCKEVVVKRSANIDNSLHCPQSLLLHAVSVVILTFLATFTPALPPPPPQALPFC